MTLSTSRKRLPRTELHYPGVHAQVTVPGAQTADGKPIEAELQLRTKSQDLWAVVSHKLDYKGAITPAKQTRRRILRLSVLAEMFDQEVGIAMNELAADPAYVNARYLQVAEAEYLRFVGEPGNEHSFPRSDRDHSACPRRMARTPTVYAEDLGEFVDTPTSTSSKTSTVATEFSPSGRSSLPTGCSPSPSPPSSSTSSRLGQWHWPIRSGELSSKLSLTGSMRPGDEPCP